MCTARGGCSQSVAEDGPSLCDSCCWEQPTPGRSGCGSGGLMGVILQVALPSRVLAAARLQCGAAGAGASRGLGVCAEHARLAARGESARAMEIGDFLGRLGPGATRSVSLLEIMNMIYFLVSTSSACNFGKHNGHLVLFTAETSAKITSGTQNTHPTLLSFGWACRFPPTHTSVHAHEVGHFRPSSVFAEISANI